jgi:hypothetical protein
LSAWSVGLTLSTSVQDAIVQGVGGEQTHFDLYRSNLMYRVGSANCACTDLTQANPSNLAFRNQLGKCFDRSLDWDSWIHSCHFEDVDGLDAFEHDISLIDRGTESIGTPGRFVLETQGALNTDNDIVCIFRILLKIVAEKVQRVCVWCAIMDALCSHVRNKYKVVLEMRSIRHSID